MHIATTVPTEDPARSGDLFARLERIGYDTGFSFEAKHDPFLPLALAAQATTRLRLGTAVAIGFARNPMVLANVGYDLQQISGGRFVLGLGSQIRPHIQNRFSEKWSRPAAPHARAGAGRAGDLGLLGGRIRSCASRATSTATP